MMAYRSSIQESTGFSPYHSMFGEECNLPMDAGLHRHPSEMELADPIQNPYALWVRDALELAYDHVRSNADQAVRRQKCLYDQRAVKCICTVGDWTMRYYPPTKKCKLDSPWPLTGCVSLRMGGWYSVTAGLRRALCTLPRPKADPPNPGPGILASGT